jgi:hypothetical protein
VYIGSNQGQTIWGHVDIVQVSLADPAAKTRAGDSDAPPDRYRPFIVLAETKPSKRHIPVWARYSPL